MPQMPRGLLNCSVNTRALGYGHLLMGSVKVATFIKLSGGLDGGLEPPAFQRAEQKRIMAMETVSADNPENPICPTSPSQAEIQSRCSDFDKKGHVKHTSEDDNLQTAECESTAGERHKIIDDSANGETHEVDMAADEPESLSDIDDLEVDGYLHNEEEKRYKKIIWEEMNKEYLEEQAAKEAAALAAKKAYEASFQNCPEEAQKLAAAAAAAVAKSKKERQQKRAAELKTSGPAQTAAEATRQMLTKKRLSSKINYDVLDKLFDESQSVLEDAKKSRTGPHSFIGDKPVKHRESDVEQEDTYGKKEFVREADDQDYYQNEYDYDEDFDYDL